ncbi:CGNR zinc finger domain-containing protein [Fodinicola feengrottensis]|uniref:CGNR zinc finger domain-containing protein n=1 Tax=Fodinicola feengrottensis TaxID=435914 RepID=A0ABN2ISH1_9ACTN|nr:CGNR zinc finger domain-containing protein [Fodinicola feengrottensis]
MANDRYGLGYAPRGLVFVQELLNTRPVRPGSSADLLATDEDAQRWLAGALAERIALRAGDAAKLRDFRATVRAVLEHNTDVPAVGSVALAARMEAGGEVTLEPRGEGWRRVASLVLLEIFVAQRLDTWRRLKICRNDPCQVAFYDRSRNNSAVWHNARICANAVNLRASRARQRTQRAAGARLDTGH